MTAWPWRRALLLYGTSFALMGAVTLALPGAGLAALSVWVSVVAVLVPALVALLVPLAGPPAPLPALRAPTAWLVAGTLLAGVPLYAGLAGLQLWLAPVQADPLPAYGPLALLGAWLAIALLPALTEELLYRGVVMPALSARFGLAAGLVATSVMFSAAHLDLAGFLPRLALGLWFGYLVVRSGSIWAGVVAHAVNNTAGLVFALQQEAVTAHAPRVLLLAALCAPVAAYAFHRAGWWRQAPNEPPAPGPRLVQVARPEPPRIDG